MRYGLPYKGSKNQIAEWIIGELPQSECFVDLFFGGGAITHCAMLKGLYKRFIINDIDGRLPKLFIECAHGKHTVDTHPEWISRDEFNRRKAEDAYIALVWSFGNTDCGKYKGFDSKRFYAWAAEQDNIFISEYSMPDEFIEIARIEKTVLSVANGNSAKQIEKLYTNRKTFDKLSDELKERYQNNTAKQLKFW